MLQHKDYFEVAAHLAHPYFDMPSASLEKLDDRDFNFNKLHSILEANRVLFRTLYRCEEQSYPLTKNNIIRIMIEKQSVFKESSALVQFLKTRILEVAETFEAHNLDFIFLKSRNILPVDSENYDVLVRDEALSTAMNLLENLGYIEIAWIQEPYKRLFRRVKNAEDRVMIHLHTKMAWDGIEFVNCQDIWNTHEKKKINGINFGFPSPEHHMLITSAHAFFENHSFRLGDLMNTVDDAQLQRQIDWNYLAQWVVDNNWATPFNCLLQFQNYLHSSLYTHELFKEVNFETLSKKKAAEAEKLLQGLVAEFNKSSCLPVPIPVPTIATRYISKIMKDPDLTFTQKISRIASISGEYAGRRIFSGKQPAFVVTFSGLDGTGKTTHAHDLYKELRARCIKTTYIWSRGTGLSFEPFLRLARKLLLGQIYAASDRDRTYQAKRGKVLNVKPVGLLWGYLTIIDHWLQITIRVRTSILMDNVVICDRYVNDTLLEAKKESALNVNDVAQKAMEAATPSPAVTFLMVNKMAEFLKDCPTAESAIISKKSNQTHFVSRNSVLIDTTKPFDENAKKILSAVLTEYYSHE